MTESRPTLSDALVTLQRTHSQLLRDQGGDPALNAEELFSRLPPGWADADGRVLLDDGSCLHVIPEHGDRSGTTGRLGVIQRFPDGRPELTHLVGG